MLCAIRGFRARLDVVARGRRDRLGWWLRWHRRQRCLLQFLLLLGGERCCDAVAPLLIEKLGILLVDLPLFCRRRVRMSMTWRISASRPRMRSILPLFAWAVRFIVYWSRFGVCELPAAGEPSAFVAGGPPIWPHLPPHG